jgi:hypothetical protein
MIACERAQSLYGPAWDDELSVAEREVLELHFAGCPSCRRDYDEFARTLELVQALPRPQVSGDFATRVLSEARRREAEGGRGFSVSRGLFARPMRLAVAAALLVAAGVSGVLIAQRPEGDATKMAQSQVLPAPALPSHPKTGDPDGPISTNAEDPRTVPSTLASAGLRSPASSTEPTLARPDRARPAEALATVPDSLFDHSADVEFVLDPVRLRRERGRGYTPVPATVRGEQASITF